ncbi:MAG: hypothetical protein HQ515_20845, partial [Phycisphaeraceae bacterium]|nr:hypothetical protein [Phycisphaeraceae bacterium]
MLRLHFLLQIPTVEPSTGGQVLKTFGKGAAVVGVPLVAGHITGKIVGGSIPGTPASKKKWKALGGAGAGMATGMLVGSVVPGIGT